MINMSARVIEARDDTETHVDYYVRAVCAGRRLGSAPSDGHDEWAAYREEPVFVVLPGAPERIALLRVERVSDTPRSTPEEAADDMQRAVRQHLDPDRLRNPARLVWGGEV